MKLFNKLFRTLETALGIWINLTIIILFAITIIIAGYITEENFIKHATESILERNYKWTYQSLIEGHTYLPINIYKAIKEHYFKEFPNIELVRTPKVDELFGSAVGKKEEEIYKIEFKEPKVIINKEQMQLIGIYPLKTEVQCLICHTNVKRDDILGFIKISLTLSDLYLTIYQTRLFMIMLGFVGILLTSIIIYLIFHNVAGKKVKQIREYIKKITEGDLTFNVETSLLSRNDIIGYIAKDTQRVQEYLINFASKILDFSLKLTKQVDKVYHAIEFANSNVKSIDLSLGELQFEVDRIYMNFNEFCRTISKCIDFTRSSEKKIKEIAKSQTINLINELLESFENFNKRSIEVLESMEAIFGEEEKLAANFDEIQKNINTFKSLLVNINQYVYESLIISTYLKNLVAHYRFPGIEEKIFDIFETDLDRYILRIESHVREIEKLDPNRWGDPLSISIGRWIISEEYKEFKSKITDFDFNKFEQDYYLLFNLGKEIIHSYDILDLKSVDKKLKEFRTNYLNLKGLLQELKGLYLKYLKK